MNDTFRYSVRPDVPLHLPRTSRHDYALTDAGWVLRTGATYWARPPVELHLREMRDVQLTSPTSLVALCDAVGDVVPLGQPVSGLTNPGMTPRAAEALARSLAEASGRRLGLPPPTWANRPPRGFHVTEVAARVETVNVLVDHLARALAGDHTAPVWQALGVLDEDPAEERMAALLGQVGRADTDAETVAWAEFAETLNRGLNAAALSPRVVVPRPETEPDTSDATDAFTAACVQIFNDLREGAPYRTCADETCGRIFRHQLGRSAGTFRRAQGVAYCSPQHARNQSQRERRRRERSSQRTES